MSRVYLVTDPTFGTIRKVADSITEAWAWAKGLSPDAIVSLPYRHCDWCDSAPCECRKHTLLVAVDGAGKTHRILRQITGSTVLS